MAANGKICFSHLIEIFLLQPFSLEKFRSLQDKLLLLDEAVAVYDGNVITAVSRTSLTYPIWKHCYDFMMIHISRNSLFLLTDLLHLPPAGLDIFKKVIK